MRRSKPSIRQSRRARQKAELIIRVQSGLLSAKQAARLLKIARQTYHKWEHRALQGMLKALCRRSPGRPAQVRSLREEKLQQQNQQLQHQVRVLQQALRIQQLLRDPYKKSKGDRHYDPPED